MSDARPALRDYRRSRAVLVGTWEYLHFDPVPAARNSMERMASLLTGECCGWPSDRVNVFGNEPGPGDLPDRLVALFEDVQDVALFYYVGHGQLDSEDHLCLSLVGSRREAHRRATTSLPFEAVRRALASSPAATKILILDCCFSGWATRPGHALAPPSADVLDWTAGTGAYTMAASGPNSTAWYETDPAAERPQTYFTKYLADRVEAGIPGQPAALRLHPLFTRLREDLTRDNRPEPFARNVEEARDFAFALNAAPAETQVDPARELALLRARVEEADAKEQALRRDAADREREVERLREQIRLSQDLATEQLQELQDALAEAARRRQEALTAHASAQDERRAASQVLRASPAPGAAQAAPQPQPEPQPPQPQPSQPQPPEAEQPGWTLPPQPPMPPAGQREPAPGARKVVIPPPPPARPARAARGDARPERPPRARRPWWRPLALGLLGVGLLTVGGAVPAARALASLGMLILVVAVGMAVGAATSRAARGRRPDRAQARPGAVPTPERPVRLLVLGFSGSGKTAMLAALYRHFSVGGPDGVRLELAGPDAERQTKQLVQYGETIEGGGSAAAADRVSAGAGTTATTRCVFSVRVDDVPACAVEYHDYAGGDADALLNPTAEQADPAFAAALADADVLLGVLDGEIVRQVMAEGYDPAAHLPIYRLLNILARQRGLAHLVVSKWDVVRRPTGEPYEVEEIVARLDQISPPFRAFRHNPRVVGLRVIRVAAFGVNGLAQPENTDGVSAMTRRQGVVWEPWRAQAPLLLAIHDIVRQDCVSLSASPGTPIPVHPVTRAVLTAFAVPFTTRGDRVSIRASGVDLWTTVAAAAAARHADGGVPFKPDERTAMGYLFHRCRLFAEPPLWQ